MKIFLKITLILVSIATFGCKAQNKMANTAIEFSSNTRGFHQKIVVQNQTISLETDRRGVITKNMPEKILIKDWNLIVAEFNKLKLETIPLLVAPSSARHTDQVAFATLKIIENQKEYQSTDFDNGNPPAEIAALVNIITKLAQKINQKK